MIPKNRARQPRDDRRPAASAILDVGTLERHIDAERIARSAYAIYESRGRGDGHADEDWLQAESEYAVHIASGQRASDHVGASSFFGH